MVMHYFQDVSHNFVGENLEAPYSGTVQVNRQIFKSTQCVPRHIAPNVALRQAYMSFHSGSAISATTFGTFCVRTLLALFWG